MGWRKLTQQIFNLEEDPVELYADLQGVGGGTSSWRLYLINNDTLTLFGQSDEVIIVSEKNQGLWELRGLKIIVII